MDFSKKSMLIALTILLLASTNTFAQFVSQQNGPWDEGATWGNNNPGIAGVDYPAQDDAVTIQNGHIVVVNNNNDNGGPANSPEGLGLPNVGDGLTNGSTDFPSAETNMFYHTGDIAILAGGTLQITRPVIFAGQTIINGTLTTTSDVVNLGTLNATSSATLDIGDDYIMTGNSVTDIDGNILTADDLYIDHLDAVIGGQGSLGIADDIQTFNPRNHDPQNQICQNFTIGCGDDCDPSSGGAQASMVGTSGHPICQTLDLPVEFKTLTTKNISNFKIVVDWSTASELNNDYFVVQHSTDGAEWEDLGTVKGAGTSKMTNYYEFIDLSPAPQYNYYRIKQVDFDGTTDYSKTLVEFVEPQAQSISLSPNPVGRNSPLRISSNTAIQQVMVINQQGKVLQNIQQPSDSINTDFAPGMYYLRIKTEEVWTIKKLVIF